MNYSGIVIDFFDDMGLHLKETFPTMEDVPDIIKTAEVRPEEELPNEAFALVAVNGGHVMRKFACYDPGTTSMSVIYFMDHKDKLPEEAVKTAAANLVVACMENNLVPPEPLIKMAEEHNHLFTMEDGSMSYAVEVPGTVNISGQSPKMKTAGRPESDDDYAFITPEGRRLYPIDTMDRIKTAERYFIDHQIRMEPVVRRHYAVKLAAKCDQVGYPLDDVIKEAGARTYAKPGHIKACMEMRKVAFPMESEDREFLDELFEKRAEIEPQVFAECLNRFDNLSGLDSMWDHTVLDPWSSTFGMQKTANDVVYQEEGDRVTEGDLINLAHNHGGLIDKHFTHDIASEFIKDPLGVFASMPLPQKKIFARMASDVSSSGGVEVNNPGEAEPWS